MKHMRYLDKFQERLQEKYKELLYEYKLKLPKNKEKYVNEKLNELPISKTLKILKMELSLLDFDFNG